MIDLRAPVCILVVVLIAVAVFGLYVPMGMANDVGCPFAMAGASLCGQPLAHLDHWQNTFLSILIEVLAFFMAAFVAPVVFFVLRVGTERQRYRTFAAIPIRPTLFQELFAKGILNRRAP